MDIHLLESAIKDQSVYTVHLSANFIKVLQIDIWRLLLIEWQDIAYQQT